MRAGVENVWDNTECVFRVVVVVTMTMMLGRVWDKEKIAEWKSLEKAEGGGEAKKAEGVMNRGSYRQIFEDKNFSR